jgi:hypothetical protein
MGECEIVILQVCRLYLECLSEDPCTPALLHHFERKSTPVFHPPSPVAREGLVCRLAVCIRALHAAQTHTVRTTFYGA